MSLNRLRPYIDHKIVKLIERLNRHAGAQSFAIPSNDYIGRSVAVSEFYENDLLQSLRDLLQKNISGGAMLDVGANIGNHSVFFCDYFSPIFSFEPNPLVFKFLEFNASICGGNITPLKFGLGEYNESRCLSITAGNLGKATVVSNEDDESHVVSLPEDMGMVQLKQYDALGIQGPIAFAKIDVEGYELAVIRGMQQMLRKDQPIICLETTLPNPELVDQLRDLGYRYYYAPTHPFRKYRGIIRQIFEMISWDESFSFENLHNTSAERSFPMLIVSPRALESRTYKSASMADDS